MKKSVILFSLFAILLTSCGESFNIKGSFSDAQYDGKTVYLYVKDSATWQMSAILDSAVIKNSKFEMKHALKENPAVGFLSVGKADSEEVAGDDLPIATVILEPGTIEVQFTGTSVTLGGTERNIQLNTQMQEPLSKLADLQVTMFSDDSTLAKRDTLIKALQDGTFSLAKENMTNQVGQYLFLSSFNLFTIDQNKELISLADSIFRKDSNVAQLSAMIEQAAAQETALKKQEADLLNKPFKDARLMNRNGQEIALSSLIGNGKYVLIDFWATWCAPCIEEIPNLTEAYSRYKNKGFEIVGISLDQDLYSWHRVIDERKMVWQHLNDAEGAVATLYDVPGIPCTLLVDKNGTIIAMNLRGPQLQEKLEEIFM